jgi:hypothetical protein
MAVCHVPRSGSPITHNRCSVGGTFIAVDKRIDNVKNEDAELAVPIMLGTA